MLLNATMIMEDKTQLGRDSNNGPIRMITTNTSDAEKRLVTCVLPPAESCTDDLETDAANG